MSSFVPVVVSNEGNVSRSYDIFSKMLSDRIIFLQGEITDNSANLIIAQILYLESVDPDKDIYIYINSPGGSVTAGMAIKDTMDYVNCDVSTIGLGMCASMGAFLLASGAYGKRYVLPNTEVMIHQPLGGFQGQATDIEIHAKRMLKTKEQMLKYMSEYTHGKVDIEKMKELCERDNFLSAQEALDIGLVDKITTSRNFDNKGGEHTND